MLTSQTTVVDRRNCRADARHLSVKHEHLTRALRPQSSGSISLVSKLLGITSVFGNGYRRIFYAADDMVNCVYLSVFDLVRYILEFCCVGDLGNHFPLDDLISQCIHQALLFNAGSNTTNRLSSLGGDQSDFSFVVLWLFFDSLFLSNSAQG